MNDEPSYFGLTNDHTWLSVDEEYYKKLKPTHRMKCYTHPVKELTGEEIEKIVKDCIEDDYHMISNPYAVAHMVQEAILRKAQEK